MAQAARASPQARTGVVQGHRSSQKRNLGHAGSAALGGGEGGIVAYCKPMIERRLRPRASLLALLLLTGLTQACPPAPDAVLPSLNALRAQGAACGARGAFPAAAPVHWNTTLADMARQHALWLVSVGDLRHHNGAGQALAERASSAGYRYARIGENLAHGQRTLDAVLRAWVVSETHCAALFGTAYTEAALACEVAADGRPLWVMVLARPSSLRH